MGALFLVAGAVSFVLFWGGFATRGFHDRRAGTWRQLVFGLVAGLLWGVVWFYIVYLGLVGRPLWWLNYPLATGWGLLAIWLWGRGEVWGPALYVFSLGAIVVVGFSGGLLLGRILLWLLFGLTLAIGWRRRGRRV